MDLKYLFLSLDSYGRVVDKSNFLLYSYNSVIDVTPMTYCYNNVSCQPKPPEESAKAGSLFIFN